MDDTEKLVEELDSLLPESKEEPPQPQAMASQAKQESSPSPSPSPLQQKIPKVPIKHPRSIDQFILDMAEKKKEQWIEDAYNKIFATLTDNPPPKPIHQEQPLPISSQQSNPTPQKQKKTHIKKPMLIGWALFIISGIAVIYLLSRIF